MVILFFMVYGLFASSWAFFNFIFVHLLGHFFPWPPAWAPFFWPSGALDTEIAPAAPRACFFFVDFFSHSGDSLKVLRGAKEKVKEEKKSVLIKITFFRVHCGIFKILLPYSHKSSCSKNIKFHVL